MSRKNPGELIDPDRRKRRFDLSRYIYLRKDSIQERVVNGIYFSDPDDVESVYLHPEKGDSGADEDAVLHRHHRIVRDNC